ncbi:hypothetical protein [Paenibacillus wynnii]|uniref:STAS/SEC14 domain-containing protein n=1 Tax=Paenibacillus wynnii TaxID=268407 RepID=A0A098M2W7_9BACL|nr:hypothetical protein [Paenibacillus wynnii]KGE16810.1 hypothetical protein PWYN_19145 [Paenibacillus wynnii]
MRIKIWFEKLLMKKQKRSVPDLRPSFLLPHKGGEVWVSCLDNLGSDIELIMNKISKNEEAIIHPNKRSRVLYHLDGTEINDRIVEIIGENIIRMRMNIYKLAIVGVSKKGERKINKELLKRNSIKLRPKYFLSMDNAKDWLVSEK